MGDVIGQVGTNVASDLNNGTLPESVRLLILASLAAGTSLGSTITVKKVYKDSWWEVSDGEGHDYVVRLNGGQLDVHKSLGNAYLIIPSGTPQLDGTLDRPQFYFILYGRGKIFIGYDGDGLYMEGMFRIVISETQFVLQVETAFALKISDATFFSGFRLGYVEITQAGLVGYFELTVAIGLPESAGFGLTGRFQFEINTTLSDKTIKRFKLNEDGNVVVDADGNIVREDHTIPGLSLRVYIGGKLILGSVFVVIGSIEITLSRAGFEMHIYGKVQVGDFGKIEVRQTPVSMSS